ncbi:methyl-accepting chemotaxis protein [Bifidobacterium pseudolongum subsp. pseudolongum]|uniref:DUF3375 family protein n=1 Tax=Bifidobacterium pseudolongum TaxID=1694 RepID=UPI000C7152DB|nr:DUF3375 family protein [Bifidobacterium pseudolongum]MDY3689797.1 DUF3375 family protein [Bifidobacterium pseudolongum]PKV08272.1 methyl-accepting chemotaxis protein [Bifidobacterium pseudolongum subsp. pseudolongum]RYQ52212.1 methyl-accepting chemotaxis protein [Bifidobacterium pseudolongum subsp. pseudolongum]RYQ54118.1 methyl-accepting chemotaxis protein [Bifidobacterium pseudolongum subsp. pseudolongum]RYQ62637.1 methyl-accepting chemotaxis protein [Bifidobacterium pseudolongum subsp. p
MADVRTELAELQPVYETGVLRMLLHKYSDIYIAILRACFDPLTAEVSQDRLLAAMTRCVGELVADGSYRVREGETDLEAARRILKELKAENEGDYAWIADSLDRRQHRWMCRLTQRAHRAIEALAALQQRTVSLSGAQVNSIIMEIENARKELTVNVHERIELLEREIEERRTQIAQLERDGVQERPTPEQVSDIINVVYNTLRGVPVDLRELVIAERDNGDALRRQMDNGSMGSDDMLAYYHEEYERTYHQSDEGRRFNDAFQVMFATDRRAQLDGALADIAGSAWLHDKADDLMAVVGRELDDIYSGIDAVRDQIRLTDESVKLLVRQHTDMQFRTMSRQLAALFTTLSGRATAKDHTRYGIGLSTATMPTLATRARETPVKTKAPALRMHTDADASALDLHGIVAVGGPRIAHMVALIAEHPVMREGAVDMAASFNHLPKAERRESEIVGFLSYLGGTESGESTWHCVAPDGAERAWVTRDVLVSPDELDEFLQESTRTGQGAAPHRERTRHDTTDE